MCVAWEVAVGGVSLELQAVTSVPRGSLCPSSCCKAVCHLVASCLLILTSPQGNVEKVCPACYMCGQVGLRRGGATRVITHTAPDRNLSHGPAQTHDDRVSPMPGGT